ncbi:carbohydrate ABC transporter permease [Paenibacillus thiaminolyticus]|uniref:carbohydrate ABC transporter permease n=1 Tax=Paenibacillus thiaminolyticus TaxID=49283 RepID=UPI003D2C326E
MKTERKTKGVRTAIRMSPGERIFQALNYFFFAIVSWTTLFPFLNLLAKSLSGEEAVLSGRVSLFPVDIQFGTYAYVLSDAKFMNAFMVSVIITLAGTALGLVMTAIAAYPLSKPRLRGRKFFILMYVFTMLFSGGLIPAYLLMHRLNLIDTLWVLFLPSMISVFNMLIIKNYFESLPDELEESAKMDGASNLMILFRITVPLSLPVFATIALFYAVGFWNDYFASMIYINSPDLKPLQLYLKELLIHSNITYQDGGHVPNIDAVMNSTPQAIQAASILVATLPILLVYPFLQKYFVKGVLIGSVKG